VSDLQQVGTMPNTGRWGWYKDHTGQEYQRATTLCKKVETDREGLDKWFRYTTVAGMAERDDLVLAAKAVGKPGKYGYTDDQKKTLIELAEKALEAGKSSDGGVKGTAVHTLTERVDRGEPVEQVCAGLPAVYSVAVRNYAKLIELNGWEIVAVERTTVCDELSVAGTLDRVYRIPGLTALLGPAACQYGDECPDVGLPGHADTVIGDVKSEGDPTHNGLHIGPQLAIYSRAERMWLPTGTYVRMPCVRQDVAFVVHIDQVTGDVRPLFVDLFKGWRLAVRAREQALDESVARRKLGTPDGFFAEVPGIKRPKIVESFVEHAVTKDYGNPNRPAEAPALATAVLDAAKANDVAGSVAVTGANGMVSWQPVPADAPVGTGRLDEVDKSAIENVWQARDLASLGETWRIYTQVCGRQWSGRVAEAADARRRQIECPQRALHTAGKCACGWVPGVPA
jgi:hypothetical protein